MNIRSLCAAAFIAIVGALPAQAVTWNFHDGQLYGAFGVDVGGTAYNVSFEEGSCASIFGGCDGSDDFDFGSQSAAWTASVALLNQVLTGIYDSDPSKTFGIGSTTLGIVLTPYWFNDSAFGAAAFNYATAADQLVTWPMSLFPSDTSNEDQYVFAKWSIAAVPVPAGLPLLLTALAGLFGLRLGRRKPLLA